MRSVLVGVAAVCLFSSASPLFGQPPDRKPQELKLEGDSVKVQGRLTADDPKDPKTQRPSQTYTLKLPAGAIIVIELVSSEFGAFLRLEDSARKEPAFDDDNHFGLNSRIVFETEKEAE